MKTIFTLLAFVATAGISVVASIPDSTVAAAVVPPHGAISTKAGATLPPDHPKEIPSDTKLVNSGKVLEVIQSSYYTYLRVSGKKGPVWLAAYKIDIAKGTEIDYSDGVEMSGFHSKSLNRTFDAIIFVDSVVPKKK